MFTKKTFLSMFTGITAAFSCFSVSAVCPLCVVAVGAGVGISRFFGVPDAVTGVWVGGLLSALALWVVALLHKTRLNRPILLLAAFVLTYASLLAAIWLLKFFGQDRACWGYGCLSIGTIIGTISFLIGILVHGLLKYYHRETVYFPFQKVVVPASVVLLASLIMFLVVRR